MATYRLRRPSSTSQPLPALGKRKRSDMPKQASKKEPVAENEIPGKPPHVTENEYMQLAKSFQSLMNEKFKEIKELKNKKQTLENRVVELTQTRATLRRGYLRCLHELAEVRLPRTRLADFKIRAVHNLVDLHSFICNEDVLDDIEGVSDTDSTDSEDDDAA